jgi:4-oxalocrotonate tautomerase
MRLVIDWPGRRTGTVVAGDVATVYYCLAEYPGKLRLPSRSEEKVRDSLLQGQPRIEGGSHMPLIQVRVIKDVFTQEQKREIIGKLTDAMVSIEGENMRNVTWCVVEEVESGDWGIGGNVLTTADVHALARGKVA